MGVSSTPPPLPIDQEGLKPGLHYLDRNGIVKSCDLSRFWLTVDQLITFENGHMIEIGSDLQPKSFWLLFLAVMQ